MPFAHQARSDRKLGSAGLRTLRRLADHLIRRLKLSQYSSRQTAEGFDLQGVSNRPQHQVTTEAGRPNTPEPAPFVTQGEQIERLKLQEAFLNASFLILSI
jgi:hypothetical protein